MSRTTILKEAIKTGLAFAVVFGIAMQLGWMNPYWAGWAVAVIALPTAGESIRKGTLRVVGTIPGCLAALAIHALAPQERWLFMLLTCGWAFLTTYLMVSRPKDSYVWVMAGYVCLIILLSDAGLVGEHVRERRVSHRRNRNGGGGLYPDRRVPLAADEPRGDQAVERGLGVGAQGRLPRRPGHAGRRAEARGELRGTAGQGRASTLRSSRRR